MRRTEDAADRRRTRSSRVSALLGLALGILLVGACATPTLLESSTRALRRELIHRLGSERGELVVLFDVDEAAVARARAVSGSGESRAERLADSLGSLEGFALRYEWAQTGTASQTLERGGGNCLALSSVLVGLARGIGLEAQFLEVRVATPKRRLDGDLSVYADHVAAVIREGGKRLYVDYSGELAKAHRVRAISDVAATAHFFTNRGYERIHLAHNDSAPIPWAEVERDFELSVKVSPGSARAWNNLAVARARSGNDRGARTAYERALELAPKLATTHVNFAMLFVRAYELDDARTHLEHAERLDPANPQLPALRRSLARAHERASAPTTQGP